MSEAKRQRSLEDENGRLKKLLAETILDAAMLKNIVQKMVTPAAKREAVARLEWTGLWSATRVVDRTTRLSARACELAVVGCHFGRRRLQVMQSREGVHMNHKKLRRLYVEERLQVRRRIGRKRAAGHRVHQEPVPQEAANGTFVAPTLIEIGAISYLPGEVFGPVLHALRCARDEMEDVIRAANATGFGCTFGLRSCIAGRPGRIVPIHVAPYPRHMLFDQGRSASTPPLPAAMPA